MKKITLLLLLFSALLFPLAGCGVVPTSRPEIADTIDQMMRSALDDLKKGNSKSGQATLDGLIRAQGSTSDAYVQVATFLNDNGRPDDALALLDPALKKSATNWDPNLWAARATALGLQKNTAGREAASREADTRAKTVLAARGQTPSQGRAAADAAVRFYQAGTYFHTVKKDTPTAIRAWRESLRLQPTNPVVLNALGYTLADEGRSRADLEEALDLTRRAYEQLPDEPAIQDSYAWALFKKGDVAVARRLLRKAVDDAPNNPELRFHMGIIYAELDQIEAADAEFARALRLRPGYEEAEDARKKLRRPAGQGVLQGA